MTRDELIEAAAKALYERDRGNSVDIPPWDTALPGIKDDYRWAINWVFPAIKPLIRADEREACARVADEQDMYWNAVAYDRRQCGRDDNFACACASMANKIAVDIRERKIST